MTSVAAPAMAAQPQPQQQNGSRKSRPTTPLRRVSRPTTPTFSGVADTSSTPLAFLSSTMAELADGLNDMQTNMEQLNLIHESLAGFNEAFASFLYGMKMNAFCVEWPEAPIFESFERAKDRLGSSSLGRNQLGQNPFNASDGASLENGYRGEMYGGHSINDDDETTPKIKRVTDTHSNGDRGVAQKQVPTRRVTSSQVNSRKKADMDAFVKKIVDTLPIKYREEEQHRDGVEQVITALKKRTDGVYFSELMKIIELPRHRLNDYCNALLHAKHVQKLNQKGLLYRLDPIKYPV